MINSLNQTRWTSVMASGCINREEVALLKLNAYSDLGHNRLSTGPSLLRLARATGIIVSLTFQWPGENVSNYTTRISQRWRMGAPPTECDCWTSPSSTTATQAKRGSSLGPPIYLPGAQNPFSLRECPVLYLSALISRWKADPRHSRIGKLKCLLVGICFNQRAKCTKLGLKHLVNFLY